MKKLLEWSKQFSHLPWRKNRSLYKTWVSEVMLQQTTVEFVRGRLKDFLQEFPTEHHLAKAKEDDVLKAWQGLGYYSRAKNLHKASKILSKNGFPSQVEELKNIPGIGPYTAGAIVAIGLNKRAMAIDANVERVLARYYNIQEEKGPKLHKKIQSLFDQNKIFNKQFRAHHEAIMDLGRLLCKSKTIDCPQCPLKLNCQSPNPLDLPKGKKKTTYYKLELLRVIVRKNNKILCYQKGPKEWLSGQFEPPTFVINSEKKITQYPPCPIKISKGIPTFSSSITQYRIKNYVLELDPKELKKYFPEFKGQWKNEQDPLAISISKSEKSLIDGN